jgi:spermidine synthase
MATDEASAPRRPEWALVLVASGAAGLAYEVVWLRRLSLLLGGSAVSGAVTVGAFMAGLALGSALSQHLGRSGPRGAARAYAALEAAAAMWALAFPWLFALVELAAHQAPALRWLGAAVLLLPPATALGATWPVLARTAGTRGAALLYAANTSGAVLGVLATTFVALPAVGVRATEVSAAVLGLAVAAVGLWLGSPPTGDVLAPDEAPRLPPRTVLAASFASGLAALGLEVVWLRLAAVALGATVQAIGWVLATFLATVALGAAAGRRWPADPRTGLVGGLAAMGALSLVGAALWGQLPLIVAAVYQWAGPEAMLPSSALVAAVAMGGAPVASGVAFSCAVRCLGTDLERSAGSLYASNTAGSIVGSFVGGLWAVPVLEVRGAVWLFAGVAALAAAGVARRPWPALPALLLALAVPRWDARLYAVGVHLRISDFADPSVSAIRRFADEGWELLLYDHGTTGAVAVGRAVDSGNVWLSINGKVDASTGDDMPTQVLSGTLPTSVAASPGDVLVVGLASGVTAGAVLRDPRVEHLTIAELEPAVVRASHFFDHVNGEPLADPRTTLVVDDARAVLSRGDRRWDVVVSEPSNPWITGVSSLFTLEYWELLRGHLQPDGVVCQWVQLYGMGPEELRGILRTFLTVFPDTWLFESIEGSDVLLIAAPGGLPEGLRVSPLLGPDELREVAGEGWLNTDDHPRVEWQAPRWLHYSTGTTNAELLRAASR